MEGSLAHIFRHPVKSLGMDALDTVDLAKGKAMPFDRRWAIAHGDADSLNGWAHPRNFVNQAFVSTGHGWMDAAPEIDRLKPDIYAVNEDGDVAEKRAFCAEHGLEYVVLTRAPKEGLTRRSRFPGFGPARSRVSGQWEISLLVDLDRGVCAKPFDEPVPGRLAVVPAQQLRGALAHVLEGV